jgi:hypothetical protein
MGMKMGYTTSSDECEEVDGLSGTTSPLLKLTQDVPRME